MTYQPSTVFNNYARYYDLLYRDKDYAAETEYVAGLIRKFNPSARSILELGSGTGKHAFLLQERGFKVHGVERSKEMLNIARAAKIEAETEVKIEAADNDKTPSQSESQPVFSEGDIRTIRLSQSFDAVIALFHVISYQTTNEDVTAVFETARQHLNPGGLFIFDVWYGPAVLTERPSVRIKRIADDQNEITRLAEPVLHPNENIVDVNYHVFVRNLTSPHTVTELKETHAMRYFFKPEIELLAAQAGVQCQQAEEWISGKEIGCDTWASVLS